MPKISSITLAAIVAAALPAIPASAANNDELCQVVATVAETVMTKRQHGVAMGDILAAIESLSDKDPKMRTVGNAGRAIVILAYDQPHYSTEDVQQKTIDDFRDQMHVLCLQHVPQ